MIRTVFKYRKSKDLNIDRILILKKAVGIYLIEYIIYLIIQIVSLKYEIQNDKFYFYVFLTALLLIWVIEFMI